MDVISLIVLSGMCVIYWIVVNRRKGFLRAAGVWQNSSSSIYTQYI